MPWEVAYLSEPRIVETCYIGTLQRPELEAAVGKTLEVALREKTTLFLGDCTRMEGGHSIIDLYDLINSIESSGLPLVGLKEAVLLPENTEAQANVGFWETACRNRAADVRIFTAREKAIEWLSGR